MKNLILCVSICIAFISSNGMPISPFDASIAAEKHLIAFAPEMVQNPEDFTIERFEPVYNESVLIAHMAFLSPIGFIAVSADSRIDPIIAYSFENAFSLEDIPQNAALQMIKKDMELRFAAFDMTDSEIIRRNEELWQLYLSRGNELSELYSDMETYGPLLETNWGQGSPYNAYSPMDPESGSRSITGCVATAITMCLNYYQWPNSMKFYDYDNYYSEYTDPPIYVEAEGASISNIDWREAGDRPSWDTVARIMFAAGVSTDMNYSSSASGTWVYAWHFMTDFGFGWADNISPEYEGFYDHLSTSIIADKPAMMSIYGSPGGHQINCDGYNSTTGQFHLNMGWEGSGNGWYSLPDGMPADFTVVNNSIVNITLPRYSRIRVPSIEFADIEEALEEAWPGDTIILSDGRYNLPGFTDVDFEALRVYMKSQNGPLACTLDCAASHDDPSQAFSFQWGEGRTAVLDGFTIMNAFTDTLGAISIKQSSPTIKNCILVNNSTNGKGGAIALEHAYPRFENCIFKGNSARMGGAFYLTKADPEIVNCSFIDNNASFAGSMYLENGSDPKILNTAFWNNYAESFGNELFINNCGDESWPYIGYSIIDIFGNYIEEDAGDIAWDDGILSVDPLIGFDPDFGMPEMESYCVNSGNYMLGDSVIFATDEDIYGTERPIGVGSIGVGYDIGAVETEYDNDNRAPVIHGLNDTLYIRAGEELNITFTVQDPDGDDIDVDIETETDAEILSGMVLSWATSTGDIGVGEIIITADDGFYTTEKNIIVNVVGGICGAVSGTWTAAESPYEINCDVYIEPSTSLEIEPGVEVIFNGPFSIHVELDAALRAIGTEDDSITFTTSDEEIRHNGIRFYSASDECEMAYCKILNGLAGGEQPYNKGGAIYCVETDLNLNNSSIVDNEALADGGAIFALNSHISLENNRFVNNESMECGGAVYIIDSDPYISENLFEANEAEDGGAIYYHGGFGDITDNQFKNNIANTSGGAMYVKSTTSSLGHNVYKGNSAIEGGGLYLEEGNGWLTNCDFYHNEATLNGGGCLIKECKRDIEIQGLWFIGNDALDGGGMAFDDGIEPVIVTSSFFRSNTSSGNGGGIFAFNGSTPVLINCTLNENEAANGGGISIAGSSNMTIFNTLIWDNEALESSGEEIEITHTSGMVFLTYSDVIRSRCSMGSGIIDFGEGCIEEDPLFEDTLGHLGVGSPCINAGDQFVTIMGEDERVMAPFRDHEESRRPLEGIWDIGADESEYSRIAENSTVNLPENISMSAYPNPFNGNCQLRISLPTDQNSASLIITDINGHKILDESIDQGDQIYNWNASGISSGVYLISIKSENLSISRKVCYLR